MAELPRRLFAAAKQILGLCGHRRCELRRWRLDRALTAHISWAYGPKRALGAPKPAQGTSANDGTAEAFSGVLRHRSQPCPYLPGRQERKLFTHLTHEKPSGLIDNLLRGGFRRSQNIAYMPYCEGCQACVSVRVVIDEFVIGRSHAPRHGPGEVSRSAPRAA